MMELYFILLFLFINGVSCNETNGTNDIEHLFQKFIETYDKPYANDSNQYLFRLAVFAKNYEHSTFLNAMRTSNYSAVFGITKFSDLSQKEFQEQFLSKIHIGNITKPPEHEHKTLKSSSGWNQDDLPLKVDWRDKGIVTGVKNQQSCGGCWAYSAVECLESANAKQTHHLASFSVQEVIDCSITYKQALHGCSGGQPCSAFAWLNETQTVLVPESRYPTTNKNQLCTLQSHKAHGIKVSNYSCHNLITQEHYILQQLATSGPVSVAVDARMWSNYMGGIIQYHCPKLLNHAVQIVGYDRSGPVPYYIIRNSWGTDWGNSGYLYLKYGSNICGVASQVSWAAVEMV